MICFDCIYRKVCEAWAKDISEECNFECALFKCEHFKNKADVVELNKDLIIYTQDKWLVINMDSKHLGEAIRRCVDDLTGNVRERYTNEG